MRRLFVLFIFVFGFLFSYAQTNTARVTLKNGITYSGQVVELNPQTHITLKIAGIETRIDISDVDSIEDFPEQSNNNDSSLLTPVEKKEVKLPDSYTIEIGPYSIKMILIEGSVFRMGYDGKGSKSLRSEPVHEVELSSFYVNSAPLEKDLVTYLIGKTKGTSKSGMFYHPTSVEDADLIVSRIAQEAKLPIKMITEAQWEYLATSRKPVFIFHYFEEEQNFCRDTYRDYSSSRVVDPCPKGGPHRVIRQLSSKSNHVYQRYFAIGRTKLSSDCAIRITFPASVFSK